VIPYLFGGVGVLGGVIVALIYVIKNRSLEKELGLLQRDHTALKEKDAKLTMDHADQVGRMQAETDGLRAKEQELNEKVRKLLSTCSDPVVLNDELNGLFPVPK
jgi:FtsZ-binding cell division protein ZapB